MSDFAPPHPNRIRAIRRRLRGHYGTPTPKPHRDPVAELVLTVLSQNTNDRNRDIAYTRLDERWATWGDVRAAPVEEIEAAIAPGGISKIKSARIKQILDRLATDAPPPGAIPADAQPPGAIPADAPPPGAIPADAQPPGAIPADAQPSGTVPTGTLPPPGAIPADAPPPGAGPAGTPPADAIDLSWVETAPLAVSRDYLCTLPGVARKTAACVLLFAYGLPDIPVDTHVGRVGMRLGLFRPKAGFEEMHDTILAMTPPELAHETHVNLIRHGRRICHARAPRCEICPLAAVCPSYPVSIESKTGT